MTSSSLVTPAPATARPATQLLHAGRRAVRVLPAVFAWTVLALMTVWALFGPWIMPHSPTAIDLQNPLRSNLGFLFDPKLHPVAFAFTSSFDIFAIWSLILYIIGFSAISRLSRGKTAAVIIVLWIVVVMLTLIGPAFQAAKMK